MNLSSNTSKDVERIKIGALEFNSEGEPIYYGIRIQDKNGDPIFETDGDGNLSITGDINATGGNFSDTVTVGNNSEDSEYSDDSNVKKHKDDDDDWRKKYINIINLSLI